MLAALFFNHSTKPRCSQKLDAEVLKLRAARSSPAALKEMEIMKMLPLLGTSTNCATSTSPSSPPSGHFPCAAPVLSAEVSVGFGETFFRTGAGNLAGKVLRKKELSV